MARQRVDLKTAAEMLSTSVDAVRKRVKRGTLEADKGEDGRVYVWLDLDQTVSVEDSHPADLIAAKDETIELLRRELEAWREEARRKDHIIAALTERIPELEGPRGTSSEARESPVTAAEGGAKGGVPPEQERRSWWRRFFGFE